MRKVAAAEDYRGNRQPTRRAISASLFLKYLKRPNEIEKNKNSPSATNYL